VSGQPLNSGEASIRDTFAAAMGAFHLTPDAKVAVAVSGGADSMALLRLLHAWASDKAITLHALTVDHALRDASRDEAEQVATWAAAMGAAHTILRWDEGAALRGQQRSLQNDARAARYGLLTAWCTAHDFTHLFVAHHADDQVETFLLRLSRGSGVDGLAAMAPATVRDDIVIARPLLGFAKAELIAFCRDAGQPWIDDPSNENPVSARVRFRQSRALLAREGLTDERLLATVAHLQRAKAALDHAVAELLASACTWDDLGVATLHVPAFVAAPDEIALRALARVLVGASGQIYGPRFEGLERLHRSLTRGPWQDATLHGAVLEREGEYLGVFRESAAIADATECKNQSCVWDGRFRLSGFSAGQMFIRPLTAALWREIAAGAADSPAAKAPARVRVTLPAIYDSQGLLAVPHAGYFRRDNIAAGALGLGVTCISAAHTRGDAEL